MRRELPPSPHLDHLKKQAKDLLASHRRGDAEATERLRAALPSLAGMTPEQVRRAPVALHDAQSAIAREHGLASWNELRAEVARRQGKPFPEAMLRALLPQPLPAAVTGALREAAAHRALAAGAMATDPPPALPLVAMRNVLIVPGSLAPIQVARPASLAAIDAALAASPPRIAVLAQRSPATEQVTAESLFPVGCEALLHARLPDAEGRAYVVLEALRWISLLSVEPSGACQLARITLLHVDAEDAAGEVPALAATLRDHARRLASVLPGSQEALQVLDGIEEPERLADIVMANLPCSVEDKARYGEERDLAARLRLVLAALGGEQAAPR